MGQKYLISQKVITKSFCKRQFPHKSVVFSFIISNIKNELTDLFGNGFLQNDLTNTFCEIIFLASPAGGSGDPLNQLPLHSRRGVHRKIPPFGAVTDCLES